MIPSSPKFLLISASAMASATPPAIQEWAHHERDECWDAQASLAFLNRAGYWAHYSHAHRLSAWPLQGVYSPEALVSAARTAALTTERPVPGTFAFVAWPWRSERPEARYAQCGIVTDVVSSTPHMFGRIIVADVIWGIVDRDGNTHPVGARHCFDTAWGDCFVEWWRFADVRMRVDAAA